LRLLLPILKEQALVAQFAQVMQVVYLLRRKDSVDLVGWNLLFKVFLNFLPAQTYVIAIFLLILANYAAFLITKEFKIISRLLKKKEFCR
jgi:hypothetical protein